MLIRVGIVGASGYTGLEAIEWLLGHPQVQITAVTSRHPNGYMLGDLYPHLMGRIRLPLEDASPEQLAAKCDVVLTCLPHGASARRSVDLLNAGCRVIDLSADFRLSCPALYEKWYGEKHPDPLKLGTTPYGLPELFGDAIPNANLIANPGCVGTASILPLAPLVKEGLIECDDIIIDCKSSVSSEGRALRKEGLYCEAAESVSVHAIGSSRHQPEITDIVKRFSGKEIHLSFTPHVVPMERGVMVTSYVKPTGTVSTNQIRECLLAYYHESPFVRVISHLPATRYVTRTNCVDIAVRENGSRITILSALDNLVKGGSGAAIQNLNLMFNLAVTTGLQRGF